MLTRTRRKRTGGRKRTSPIWKMPEDEYRQLVINAPGIGRVLEAFGMENKGRNHNTARKRITELGIDASHFDHMVRARSEATMPRLIDVLVKNSRYSQASIKRRLIANGMLKNECYICGMPPAWRGSPLTLRLDHINGDSKDARPNNLRLLCPNCDAQQDTFCGRNRRIQTSGGLGPALNASEAIGSSD